MGLGISTPGEMGRGVELRENKGGALHLELIARVILVISFLCTEAKIRTISPCRRRDESVACEVLETRPPARSRSRARADAQRTAEPRLPTTKQPNKD